MLSDVARSRAAHALAAFALLAACTPDASPVLEYAETSPPLAFDPSALAQPKTQAWRGEVLFVESFDDLDFNSRGWYDRSTPSLLSTTVHAPGSTSSLECRFEPGASTCSPRPPARRRFDGVDELHVSYWVRYSDDWVGSGRPYHPHEIHFLTNADGEYTGPSYTHLTLYVEQVDLIPRVALQDAVNVDPRCILRNDDSVAGCNGGSIEDFPFGEDRSVAACNGLVGPVALRDCYSLGGDRWYSSRSWPGSEPILSAQTGQDGWHFVEVYFGLNSIQDGEGVPDGLIRLWVDGDLVISVDSILFRTGEHPDLLIDQLLLAPFIGDGSPAAQTMWLDELTVSRGRRP